MGGMCLEEWGGIFGCGDRRIVVAYNLQYSSASMRMFSSENFKLYEGVNYLLKIFWTIITLGWEMLKGEMWCKHSV